MKQLNCLIFIIKIPKCQAKVQNYLQAHRRCLICPSAHAFLLLPADAAAAWSMCPSAPVSPVAAWSMCPSVLVSMAVVCTAAASHAGACSHGGGASPHQCMLPQRRLSVAASRTGGLPWQRRRWPPALRVLGGGLPRLRPSPLWCVLVRVATATSRAGACSRAPPRAGALLPCGADGVHLPRAPPEQVPRARVRWRPSGGLPASSSHVGGGPMEGSLHPAFSFASGGLVERSLRPTPLAHRRPPGRGLPAACLILSRR
jgi:hypothetical protein